MEVSTSRRFSVASTSGSSESSSSSFWDNSSSPASSPSTSYSASFSSGPSNRSAGYARRRANTGASISFDAVARMHTLNEQHEDVIQATPTDQAASPEATEEDDHVATMEIEPIEEAQPPAGPRPKLTQRLLSKTRDRASSLGKLSFTRPKLERRETTMETDPNSRTPLPSPSLSLFKSKRFKQLRGRFAQSAPVSPAFTPSPSTDKFHLFHSRPSSVVLTGTGTDNRASFYFPAAPYATSPIASSKSSCYVPMLEELVVTDESEANEVFVDAYPRNVFDGLLPREVRIKVFSKVIENSVQEHEGVVRRGEWTAYRASQERWVGEAGGLRELVKLSRVCRAWRDLAFDGQLWQSIDIARTVGNDTFVPEGLVRLSMNAGSFLRKLDLRGFAGLRSEHLEGIANGCLASTGFTSIAYVDLTGCRAVSSKALHYLLSHSPEIDTLKLRGLPAVVSSTCYVIIASAVKNLQVLDVSLCRNLLAAALLDLNQPSLQKLYAAKIPSMDDATLGALPTRFSGLQVLDVGYSRSVTDAAFGHWHTQAGNVLKLRQLRLSGCSRLTDQTCWNLLGKVPGLECLELACIGVNLRDGGVVKLVESLPKLCKIDLEDATSLTDRVVIALTPAKQSWKKDLPPLEHVNLTNVPELTEQALVRLVRACPKLRIAECSSSFHVSDAFVKAFTQHVKRNKVLGAELNIVDCRSIGGQTFREGQTVFRPRRGLRDYASRHFEYIDQEVVRGKGVSECDHKRIVIHSFWSWQQLDEEEKVARASRAAKLAIEGGAAPSRPGPMSPSILRQARRASFGLRADGGSSSCIIS